MQLLESLVFLKKTYLNCSSGSLADLQEGKCFHSRKMGTARLSTGDGGRFLRVCGALSPSGQNDQWRIQGGRSWCTPRRPKIFAISCSFLENFGKIVGWRPLLWTILDPPLMTDTCENITFSQLCWRAIITCTIICLSDLVSNK